MTAYSSTFRHRTVLLVDEADDRRVITRLFLNNFGYSVDTTRTAEEALLLFDPKTHDIVIVGSVMAGLSGSELAHIVKLRSPNTRVLMYTDLAPKDRSCLDAVIEQPAHLLQLRENIENLFAQPTV